MSTVTVRKQPTIRNSKLTITRELSQSISRNSRPGESSKALIKTRSKSIKQGNSNVSVNVIDDLALTEQSLESPLKLAIPRDDKSTPGKGGRNSNILPSIMSNRKDPLEIYKQNYQLNIDSLLLNARQNQVTLNNYYRKMVRQRMPFASQITSPHSVRQDIGFGQFSALIQLPPLKQAELSKALNNGLQEDGPFMIKADDSIFIELKKEAEDLMEGSSFVDKSKSTQPFTSRIQNSLSYQEASLTEAIAGNQNTLKLNQGLHQFALRKIENQIEITNLKRSRQRRKRELGVADEAAKDDEARFNLRGCFDPRSDEVSLAETVANSSVYHMINGDLDNFEKYLTKEKEKQATKPKRASEYDGSEFNRTLYSDEENPTKDPEYYFQKLRAKIKLKATRMYQEDRRQQADAAKQAKEPTIEVKDKFGRVMEKIGPGQPKSKPNSESPKPRRKPAKAPPLKRKMSFTECQLKYADKLLLIDPMKEMKKPTITDLITVKKMQASDRWPIPEQLINRPEKGNFSLVIDSIMHAAYNEKDILEWAAYRQELDVPYNSMESENEYPLEDSHDSEEEANRVPKPTKYQKKHEENFKEKQFDRSLIEQTNFRIENMRSFPHRVREGEVPFKLGKLKHAQGFIEAQERMANQQKGAIWSMKLVQNVFEHYCVEMKAAPIPIGQYIITGDNKIRKLTLKNYNLDEATAKALACIIPFIVDIEEMEFSNNQLMDHVAAALVLGFFQNPSLHKMTITYNFLRGSFCKTLTEMIKAQPDKITSLNLMGSIASSDHMEHICKNLEYAKQLITINFSGNNFSVNTCRILGNFMTTSYSLRDVDIAHCRISYQGTRYIIDALNRNTYIRQFNFAFNDLTSSAYEFSIKLASIITRHPSLMHLDLSKTNLKREEVLFIGLSLSTSKTLLSVHLTANELPYYERIFLRSTIAARVGFEFRNFATKKEVKSNKERNQVLQMASGEVYDESMKIYTQNLRELDLKREGLDFEISDMIMEMDTVASFQDLPDNAKLEDIPQNTKIGQLVAKIVERNKEIEQTKLALQNIYNKEGPSIKKALEEIKGLEEIGLYNFDQFGNVKPGERENAEKDNMDYFEQQKALKVQRQRQKAERIATKEARDRSAGELALMFMGINQIAYELLVENPMTGYMNEIIFSRVLGYDDIEQGTYWCDSTQCWICQKWNKVEIKYHMSDDYAIFAQKVFQIDSMHLMINRCIQDSTKKVVAQLRKEHQQQQLPEPDNVELIQHRDDDSFILEVEEEFEATTKLSGGLKTGDLKMTGLKTFRRTSKNETSKLSKQDVKRSTMAGKSSKISSIEGSKTISETGEADNRAEEQSKKSSGLSQLEASDAETEVLPVPNPMMQDLDQTNLVSPIKLTVESVKKTIFPENFKSVNEFEPLKLRNSFDYSNPVKHTEEQRKLANRARISMIGGNPNMHSQSDVNQLRNHFVSSRSHTISEGELEHQASVISVTEHRRRKRGEATIVQKIIFFEGIVYQIEEEVYSDSDHSSVYTSEDDFETDKQMAKRYKNNNPLLSEADLNDPILTDDARTRLGKKFQSRQSTAKHTMERKLTTAERSILPQTDLNLQGTGQGQHTAEMAREPNEELLVTPDREKPLHEDDTPKGPKTSLKKTAEDASQMSENSPQKKKVTIKTDAANAQPGQLSQKQMDYESKTMPKHYNPSLMKVRMKRFDEIDSTMSQSMGRQKAPPPKGPIRRDSVGSFIGKERTTNTDGFKPIDKVIYVVASFNDWQPSRMKTLRTLNLEKYPVFDEEVVPKHVFMLDNTVVLYANMVPPGTHYFYFVKDRGSIFLSPKYDVVRFKNTNIFLNRIIVKRRIKDLDTVHIARDADDDEAVFMKDRSVFREFIENTPQRLQKAFDEDIGFSKIHKTVKSDPVEMQKIADCLFSYYEKILEVYHYYIGISSYPTIAMNEFTSFSQKCHFMDNKNINLAALDRILITTNVTAHNYTSSAERDLQRYEFLEIIVRLANAKYKETHQANTTVDAIHKLLNENIFPNAKRVDGENFRKYHCYNVKTNEILKKNESQIKKVYDSFTHSKKRWVTMEECQRYVRNMNLNVSEMMVGPIYAESLCLIIDTIRDQTRPNQMKFVEFLVFICRIAKEHYDGSPYENEAHYLKMDHLLPTFLKECNIEPNFLFGEKFEHDKMLEKKRRRRNKRKILKAKRNAQLEGKEFNPEAVQGLIPAPIDENKSHLASDKSQLMSRKDAQLSSSGSEVDIDQETTESDDEAQYRANKVDDDKVNKVLGSISSLPTDINGVPPSDSQLERRPDIHDNPNLNKDLNAELLKPEEERKQMTETTEAAIIEGLMKPRLRAQLTEKPKKEEPLVIPVDLEKLETQKKLDFSAVLKEHIKSEKPKLTKDQKEERIARALEKAGDEDDLERDI